MAHGVWKPGLPKAKSKGGKRRCGAYPPVGEERERGSDGGGDGPLEGAEAELGGLFVEGFQTGHDVCGALVLDDGDDGRVLAGPGVGAEVRLAGVAATSVDDGPGGEATAVVALEHFNDAVVVGLVKSYQYCLHCFCFWRLLMKVKTKAVCQNV